jgi:hypothetical protein
MMEKIIISNIKNEFSFEFVSMWKLTLGYGNLTLNECLFQNLEIWVKTLYTRLETIAKS